MMKKGGGLFSPPSPFLNKKGLLKIWSKIYSPVCMCDVRVKKLLAFFGEINSKCLVGVEGVTGNGGSSKNVYSACACVYFSGANTALFFAAYELKSYAWWVHVWRWFDRNSRCPVLCPKSSWNLRGLDKERHTTCSTFILTRYGLL